MADIRIKDLASTATTTASDDFMAVDGTTNGTRKLSAAAPAFLTSVTTPSLTSPALSPLTLGTGTSGAAITVLSASNNVGIGTTSPGAKLDVLTATAPGTVDGTNSALKLGFDGGNVAGTIGAGVTFSQRYDVTDTAQIRVGSIYGYKHQGTGSFGGGLLFYTQPPGAASQAERMRIDTTGNVGIGTTSPGEKLEVFGTAASAGINLKIKNNADTGGNNVQYAGINFVVGSDNGTSAIRSYRTNIGNDYTTALAFLTNPTGATQTPVERMRIDSAGNVGIGTTSPGAYKLNVAGGPVNISDSTAGSAGAGALVVTGGLSAGGASYFGGAATFAGAVAIGNTVAAAVAVASTHKVTVVIGGVTYYLLATNVP